MNLFSPCPLPSSRARQTHSVVPSTVLGLLSTLELYVERDSRGRVSKAFEHAEVRRKIEEHQYQIYNGKMILSWIKDSPGGDTISTAQGLQLTLSRGGRWSWGSKSGWKVHGAVQRGKPSV
jgi:hypothetical protein